MARYSLRDLVHGLKERRKKLATSVASSAGDRSFAIARTPPAIRIALATISRINVSICAVLDLRSNWITSSVKFEQKVHKWFVKRFAGNLSRAGADASLEGRGGAELQ